MTTPRRFDSWPLWMSYLEKTIPEPGLLFPSSKLYEVDPEEFQKEVKSLRAKLDDEEKVSTDLPSLMTSKHLMKVEQPRIDIERLLGSKGLVLPDREHRDFLVSEGGIGAQKIKDLKGNYVFIACFVIPFFNDSVDSHHSHALIRLWEHLHKLGIKNVKFVLVFLEAPKWEGGLSTFRQFFGSFPADFLAIPHWDEKGRKRACISICGTTQPNFAGVIIDPDGRPVPFGSCIQDLRYYGPDFYPFTLERTEELSAQDSLLERRLNLSYYKMTDSLPDDAANMPLLSVADILGCHPEDRRLMKYSPDVMELSPVSELMNGQLVGLYLYRNGDMMKGIEELVQQCSKYSPKFELLVVPLALCDYPASVYSHVYDVVSKTNISSCWFMFPYDDKVARTLWRVAGDQCSDVLILLPVGNQNLYGDLNARVVIDIVGLPLPPEVYPFTIDKLYQERLSAIRRVTLSSVLGTGVVNSCTDPGCSLPVNYYDGKKVLLFLYSFSLYDQETMLRLKKHYKDIKDKHGFEVICVPTAGYPSDTHEMPWMIVPPAFPTDSVLDAVFLTRLGEIRKKTALISFGEDGLICSRDGVTHIHNGNIAALSGDSDTITEEILDGVMGNLIAQLDSLT